MPKPSKPVTLPIPSFLAIQNETVRYDLFLRDFYRYVRVYYCGGCWYMKLWKEQYYNITLNEVVFVHGWGTSWYTASGTITPTNWALFVYDIFLKIQKKHLIRTSWKKDYDTTKENYSGR
jgi:hypothetical protein